jgi:hypothetical protein
LIGSDFQEGGLVSDAKREMRTSEPTKIEFKVECEHKYHRLALRKLILKDDVIKYASLCQEVSRVSEGAATT